MRSANDCLYSPCRADGLYDGYCGPHRRMVERDKLRAQNPSLTHCEAERLVPRFNHAADKAELTADAKALRYVFPKLKYRDAKADVLRFNATTQTETGRGE